MSAAQWWADLPQAWRDKLHAEFPEAMTPGSLQENCRESYPEKATRKKKDTFARRESKPRTGKKARKVREEDDDYNNNLTDAQTARSLTCSTRARVGSKFTVSYSTNRKPAGSRMA
jgi:hypothetical protein